MQTIWNTFIYEPIYNTLVFIAQNITFQDVGLAVVVLTILIRFILMPLSKKSIVSQYKMRLLQPKLDALKSKGLSREEEAKEQFALYKTEGINPFSGCLYLIIQLPILFALYFSFMKGVDQPTHLYSFLSTEGLKNTFLGIIDITKPFIPFAILAGITQAIQAFIMPKPPETAGNGFQAQFTKSLSMQTKYVLPIIIIFISAKLASAVALYWVITNIFSISQELYFRKSLKLNTKN
jgi:YidC/Oxa1 family membrane protein insertase